MDTSYIKRLAKESISCLKPYAPPPEPNSLCNSIKLDANESLIGPSPRVMRHVQEAITDIKYYPDANGQHLKSRLAEKYHVMPSQITLGNGSNDVLDAIARVFSGPGDENLYSQYSFAVYPIVSLSTGANPIMVPSLRWGNDLAKILDTINTKTKIIFLANPNNPTGTWFDSTQFDQFIQAVPQRIIIVLDEAYFEYSNNMDLPNGLDYLKKYSNLIVTRTFSKAYGLAALRIGYAISHPDAADLLNRVRQPFNVNRLGLIAAHTALDDLNHLDKTIELTKRGMQQWLDGLDEIGMSYIPSRGNFLCINVGNGFAVTKTLADHNIMVSPLINYGMPEYIRVSIGTERENRSVLSMLAKLCADPCQQSQNFVNGRLFRPANPLLVG
jgi:histidinol-phosphate aminotransferase